MSHIGSFGVEKFRGENYNLWKLKVSSILKAKKLWAYVDQEVELEEKETEKEDEAYATLILSLADNQLRHVEKARTASEVWKILQDIHCMKTAASKHYLRRQLANCNKLESESMEDFVQKVEVGNCWMFDLVR